MQKKISFHKCSSIFLLFSSYSGVFFSLKLINSIPFKVSVILFLCFAFYPGITVQKCTFRNDRFMKNNNTVQKRRLDLNFNSFGFPLKCKQLTLTYK